MKDTGWSKPLYFIICFIYDIFFHFIDSVQNRKYKSQVYVNTKYKQYTIPTGHVQFETIIILLI